MPCDNAMQLQTPAPGTKHQNLGYSPVAPANCPTPRAETAFSLVDFYKACHFTPMVVQLLLTKALKSSYNEQKEGNYANTANTFYSIF